MSRKLVKTWKYKAGYHIRYEELSGEEAGGGKPFVMRSAYTPYGDYIGSPKMARLLYLKMGIVAELSAPIGYVCQVGFKKENQKWYGWSHRAICGFGIGDRLFIERCPGADENTPFVEHGIEDIQTLKQARISAVNFADYVA